MTQGSYQLSVSEAIILERDPTPEGIQTTIGMEGNIAKLPAISPTVQKEIGRMLGQLGVEVQ